MKRTLMVSLSLITLVGCGVGIDTEDLEHIADKMTLSCDESCRRVDQLCKGKSGYGESWVGVCRSACENKEKVKKELAREETSCVSFAPSCDKATACVADL